MTTACNIASSGLKRQLGLFSATAVVVANMVGTGAFTTSGFVMEQVGSPTSLLLCWFLGGLFALSGALCYGKLGALFPKAGGEYVFLRESFGALPSFLSGWISLIVGFSAPIAASAIAFAGYVFQVLPQPSLPFWTARFGDVAFLQINPVTLSASALILLFSGLHAGSVRMGSNVLNALTVLKILLILALVMGGFLCIHSYGKPVSASNSPASLFGKETAVSLVIVSFAYSGWNSAAYLGAEIREPGTNIPRSLLLGTAVVMLLYLLLNLLYVMVLSPEKMSGVLEVAAETSKALFGPDAARAFNAAVALSLVSAVGAMIMTGPRVYFAMARDGLFFRGLGTVDGRHGASREGGYAPGRPGGPHGLDRVLRSVAHLYRLHLVPVFHRHGIGAHETAEDQTRCAAPLSYPGLPLGTLGLHRGEPLDCRLQFGR